MLHAALASGPCRRPVTGPRAVPPGETHSHSRRAGATRARDDLAERCSRRSRCGHGAWPIHGDGTRVEPPNCTPAAARRPGWRWRRERTFCVHGRVGKDELSERALCQAARAQIAAPQQDLHLRGLGADDICVFIVVAVAYLLFHAGRSRELWARPGARLPRRETRYRSLLAARASLLAGRLEPHWARAVTRAATRTGWWCRLSSSALTGQDGRARRCAPGAHRANS